MSDRTSIRRSTLHDAPAGKVRAIRPYSRPHVLTKLDGRTREAQLMQQVREDLTSHCGGNPSVTQRLLIDRASILTLKVAQIDRKILTGESLTLHDSNYALAWNNALRRTLTALGVKPAEKPAPSLADLLTGREVAI
jgi:hypothetical protein